MSEKWKIGERKVVGSAGVAENLLKKLKLALVVVKETSHDRLKLKKAKAL